MIRDKSEKDQAKLPKGVIAVAPPSFRRERALIKRGVWPVAGCDEAGRGPLAGPVTAAAVVLNPRKPIQGLADSKILTAKKREALYGEIVEKALAWHVAEATVEEIDRINILHATMLAMQRAVQGVAAQGVLPDLVQRDFAPTHPDELWVGDITYVRTWEGWLYLSTIIDCFSRRVIGWAMADHLRTELPLTALHMALARRNPSGTLIHHTDRGCQYTSEAYTNVLASHGVRSSLSRPGNCWDNAVAESFFSTLKLDLLYRHSWPTRAAARSAIFEYIEGFYNRERRHTTLGNLSPADYESAHAAVCSG